MSHARIRQLLVYNAKPAARRPRPSTLPTPVAIAAAAALDEADGAAVPEGVSSEVPDEFDVSADEKVALKPVLLRQLAPAVSLAPETNLTGAH